jgi:hypothetical protein
MSFKYMHRIFRNLQEAAGSIFEVFYFGQYQIFQGTGLFPVYAPMVTRHVLPAVQP